MKKDPFLAELDRAALHQLLKDMFIYTHGLCTLAVLNGKDGRRDRNEEKERLLNMGGQLITAAVMKSRGLLHLDEILGGEQHEHRHT